MIARGVLHAARGFVQILADLLRGAFTEIVIVERPPERLHRVLVPELLQVGNAEVALAEVQSALTPNLQKIERLYVPQKTKKTETLEGSPSDIAKKLVDKLRNELHVL